ncbi:hypothetical protein Dimus_003191 [Dionaea muscipula]
MSNKAGESGHDGLIAPRKSSEEGHGLKNLEQIADGSAPAVYGQGLKDHEHIVDSSIHVQYGQGLKDLELIANTTACPRYASSPVASRRSNMSSPMESDGGTESSPEGKVVKKKRSLFSRI